MVKTSKLSFFQADPYYANKFQPGSMNPKQDKHETDFVIEAQTGIPLKVTARWVFKNKINYLI